MSDPLDGYLGKHDEAFGNATPDPTANPWVGTVFEDWDGENDETVTGWGAKTDLAERGMKDGLDTLANGQAAFAAVKFRGWHNLGKVYDHPVPASQMLVDAGANYDVTLIEDAGVVRDDHGNILKVLTNDRGRKVARVDNGEITAILGTATARYKPFNNEECFIGFGDALTQLAETNAATCGVMDGGRRAFMSWKLSKEILVGGQDAADLWLLVSTSHDGSEPLRAAITPLRTVCQNTCRWNWKHAVSKWTIRHTKNAKLAIHDATNSLKLSYAYVDQWEKAAEQMIAAQMSTDQFTKVIEEVFGPGEDAKPATVTKWTKKKDRLVSLFTEADTQANCRNTAWAGLQAIGEHQDWGLNVATPGWEDNAQGLRFSRSLFEEKTTQRPKEIAFGVFSEYAGVKF